ncbi:MAG: hypothetical protein CVV41_01435 [Candidatus Riflebacteria bacterium HGW-Riflebacteria-1]|jgi:nitroreductase/NAD-dependent dihydropyrimidine dehydrogenase PreA subunit|nr:MAG: hypothetical protein CVV41_01435 [Candidatus Riflebacteria bacterium HGW-Riflebacteria-1]
MMTENNASEAGEVRQVKPLVVIDPTKCVACGLCASICPARSIIKQEGKKPPEFAKDGRCIRCGHCVSACPTGALGHIEMTPENFKTIDATWTPEMIETFLLSKRSVRHFTDKPVARETLEKLLDVAAHAPSDANQQDRSFMVLTDRSLIEGYEAAVIDYYRKTQDELLASGVDPMFWKLLYIRPLLARYEAGDHPIFRGASSLVCAYARKDNYFGWYNCAIAMDYLMLMAHSMGIESCIIGFSFNPAETGHKFLGLSDEHQLHSVVALGYPKYRFRRTVQRRPAEVIWRS